MMGFTKKCGIVASFIVGPNKMGNTIIGRPMSKYGADINRSNRHFGTAPTRSRRSQRDQNRSKSEETTTIYSTTM